MIRLSSLSLQLGLLGVVLFCASRTSSKAIKLIELYKNVETIPNIIPQLSIFLRTYSLIAMGACARLFHWDYQSHLTLQLHSIDLSVASIYPAQFE